MVTERGRIVNPGVGAVMDELGTSREVHQIERATERTGQAVTAQPVTIHIDGLCQPTNPDGYCCWAYVAQDASGKEIGLNYGCVGRPGDGLSNNVAEYQALIEALKRATAEHWRCCRILSDSQLVVNQTLGQWKCNQPHLQKLAAEAARLLANLHASLEWIPREQNKRADHLTNVAYNKARMEAA